MMSKFGVFSLCLLMISSFGFSQENDYGNENCKELVNSYTSLLKSNNFKGGFEIWKEVNQNCAELSQYHFERGIDFYHNRVANLKGSQEMKVALDEMLSIFDVLINQNLESDEFYGEKGLAILKYDRKNTSLGRESLKKAVYLNPEHCSPKYMMGYFRSLLHAIKMNEIGEDEIRKEHSKLSNILDARMSNSYGQNNDSEIKLKRMLDEVYFAFANCLELESFCLEDYDRRNSLNELEKMRNRFLKAGCKPSIEFNEVLFKLSNEENPSYTTAYALGKLMVEKKDLNAAKDYYISASRRAENEEDRGKALLLIAQMDYSLMNFREADRRVRNLMVTHPYVSDLHLFRGKIVFQIAERNSMETRFEESLVYLLAADIFEKSENREKSPEYAQALANFPTINMIFASGINEGSVVNVPGFSNETTMLRRRNE